MSRVSEWDIERVWECERVRECQSESVTFELRDENKSCSACPDWVNERVQVLQVLQILQVIQSLHVLQNIPYTIIFCAKVSPAVRILRDCQLSP